MTRASSASVVMPCATSLIPASRSVTMPPCVGPLSLASFLERPLVPRFTRP